MPSKKGVVTAIVIAVACSLFGSSSATGSAGGFGGDGGDGGGSGGGEIGIWVVGGTGGHSGGGGGSNGVTCQWLQITTAIVPVPAPVIPVTRIINGQLYNLYARICSDGTTKSYWIPAFSAPQLAQAAVDIVTRKLPALTPNLSPPVNTGGFVNYATVLAATDPGPISADAAIPALRATVTARVAGTVWDLGDGTLVQCDGVGTPRSQGTESPCSHTYATSSAHQQGTAFPIVVSVRWSVRWRSSNGQTGTLPDITTTTSFAYRVREIQTIGQAG